MILRRLQWIAAPPHTRAMGFKRASGTRDTVSTLIHDLTECRVRKRNKCAAVFLDLKQALELVDAGVSGQMLQWCGDFLTCRRAVLDFQSVRSCEMDLRMAHHKAAPCFFNYAMNTFLTLNQLQGVKVIAYADDICLQLFGSAQLDAHGECTCRAPDAPRNTRSTSTLRQRRRAHITERATRRVGWQRRWQHTRNLLQHHIRMLVSRHHRMLQVLLTSPHPGISQH